MARRKTIEQLTKQLEYANRRKAFFLTNPQKTTYDKNPKSQFGYYSALIKQGTANALMKVQVGDAAVTAFGGASALKLVLPTAEGFNLAIPLPRGFRPSKIHAVFGDVTPTKVTAKTSGRKYVKYNRTSTGEQQSSYTSVVNGTGTTVTITEQQATAAAIATAIKSQLTVYGRLTFEPEYYGSSLV